MDIVNGIFGEINFDKTTNIPMVFPGLLNSYIWCVCIGKVQTKCIVKCTEKMMHYEQNKIGLKRP